MIRKHSIALFILLIPLVLFFGKTISDGLIPYYCDISFQNLPAKVELSTNLKNFSLPLWTWKGHCSYPLLAEGQAGAPYPVNLILFYTLSAVHAFWIYILLHLYLAASGFYLFLYRKKGNLISPWCIIHYGLMSVL